MLVCYVRWPNKDHTIAVALSKEALIMLLDQQGDPWCALYKTITQRMLTDGFAIDFRVNEEAEEDEDPVEESAHAYESTSLLMEDLIQLSDSQLVTAQKYFEGCRDMIQQLADAASERMGKPPVDEKM